MLTKGAPGTHDVPPTFLTVLGLRVRQELLDIFNLTCSSQGVAPDLKDRHHFTPQESVKTTRMHVLLQTSQSSTLNGKTLEGILHNRLYYLADPRDWLCTEQAGFPKNRSSEDHILYLTQSM